MLSQPTDRSYRALLSVPSLGRSLLGMQISRVAQAMIGVAMVLFALAEYGSPFLAGMTMLAAVGPGILISPIAGALLDRHGRTRLIVLDQIVAMASLVLIGALALADALPVWLLFLITILSSLTTPLSATGLRTLFPLIVPRHLWERVNAIDANGYVVAAIFGPPIAASCVALFGGAVAIIIVGLAFGIAALILAPVPEPPHATISSGRLLRDALDGLRYTWRNPTLRGLAFSISMMNLAGGAATIIVPLVILERFDYGEAAVGAIFALQGITGTISGLLAGRMDTHGRERRMIALPMLACAPLYLMMLPEVGPIVFIVAFAALGLLFGPMDVAMFTVRQRRTDPAWMGRAFAISMSLNFSGFPIGSAVAGALADGWLEGAVILAAIACLAGALLAHRMIPDRDPAVAPHLGLEPEPEPALEPVPEPVPEPVA